MTKGIKESRVDDGPPAKYRQSTYPNGDKEDRNDVEVWDDFWEEVACDEGANRQERGQSKELRRCRSHCEQCTTSAHKIQVFRQYIVIQYITERFHAEADVIS